MLLKLSAWKMIHFLLGAELLPIFRTFAANSRECTGVELSKFTPPKFNMEPENDGFQKE